MTDGGSVVFPSNKTDGHNITETLLKVALNPITLTLTHIAIPVYQTISEGDIVLFEIHLHFKWDY